jgi:hypothetical protein
VQTIGYMVAFVGLVWGAVLIVLLVLGVYHLSTVIHAKPHWVTAWSVAVLAGVVLEVGYFLGPSLTKGYPGYVGEVTVRPEYLWLAAGFLVVGATMLGILRAAE